jgi:hypothetical protein
MVLIACETTPKPDVNVTPEQGGTITSSDGKATLEVPAGAVTEAVKITLSPVTDGIEPLEGLVAGSTYKLEGSSGAFAKPVRLSLSSPQLQSSRVKPGDTPLFDWYALDQQNQACKNLPDFIAGVGHVFIWWDTGYRRPNNQGLSALCVVYDYDHLEGMPTCVTGWEFVSLVFAGYCELRQQELELPPFIIAPVSGLLGDLDSGDLPALQKQDLIHINLGQITLETTFLKPGVFGILNDKVAPIQIEALKLSRAGTVSKLAMFGNWKVADNIGVKRIELLQVDYIDPSTQQLGLKKLHAFSVPAGGQLQTIQGKKLYVKNATFPWLFNSPRVPLASLDGQMVFMTFAFDAAGNALNSTFTEVKFPKLGLSVVGANSNPKLVAVYDHNNSSPTPPSDFFVNFYAADGSKICTDTSAPFECSVNVPTNKTRVFYAEAKKSDPVITEMLLAGSADVSVTGQNVPLALNLAINPNITTITTPRDATLVATPFSTTAISKVEFFDGINKLGEDITSPYEWALSLTGALNGSHSYSATVSAANSQTASSSPIAVTVNIISSPAHWFVDPVNGLDSNDGTSEGVAFKTICQAKIVAITGQVIGLMPGTYDGVNQNKAPINGACTANFNVPVTVKALEPFATLLRGIVLNFSSGGTVEGLKFENDPAQNGKGSQITASAGTLNINGLYLQNQVVNSSTLPVSLSGTVQATLTPGVFDNYLGSVPNGKALTFANVNGSAQLTVQGGTFVDETNPTNSDPFCSPLFSLNSPTANVTLNTVTVRHKGSVARVTNGTFTAQSGSILEDVSTANNVGCLPTIDLEGAGNVLIQDSTIRNGVDGIATDNSGSYRGTVTLSNAAITGHSKRGVFIFGNSTTPPTINITNSSFNGNLIGLETAGRVNLKMRGTNVKSNTSVGIKLTGATTSSFDLGAVEEPGNNTFTGNTTTGLRLEALLTLNAVGNTWNANQQGADAQGKYAAQLKSGSETGLNYSLPAAGNQLQF